MRRGAGRGTLALMDDVLRVVGLCAQWCGVCRDHAAVFADAAQQFGGAAEFRRIDIEDEAALLDGVEVENFPTLLIARGPRVLFYGTITPQLHTLARLVRSALADELPASAPDPEIAALAQRLAV